MLVPLRNAPFMPRMTALLPWMTILCFAPYSKAALLPCLQPARPHRHATLVFRMPSHSPAGANPAAIHIINSVHAAHRLDNSNLRTHPPNRLLLITRSQAILMPRFLLSAFQPFRVSAFPPLSHSQ